VVVDDHGGPRHHHMLRDQLGHVMRANPQNIRAPPR